MKDDSSERTTCNVESEVAEIHASLDNPDKWSSYQRITVIVAVLGASAAIVQAVPEGFKGKFERIVSSEKSTDEQNKNKVVNPKIIEAKKLERIIDDEKSADCRDYNIDNALNGDKLVVPTEIYDINYATCLDSVIRSLSNKIGRFELTVIYDINLEYYSTVYGKNNKTYSDLIKNRNAFLE